MQGSCSCTIPIGLWPAPQPRAPAEGTARALTQVHAAREAPCLGRSAVAAHAPAPRLPGAGMLLPAWRRLAQLLALMTHQVPTAAQLAHMLQTLAVSGTSIACEGWEGMATSNTVIKWLPDLYVAKMHQSRAVDLRIHLPPEPNRHTYNAAAGSRSKQCVRLCPHLWAIGVWQVYCSVCGSDCSGPQCGALQLPRVHRAVRCGGGSGTQGCRGKRAGFCACCALPGRPLCPLLC